METGGLETGNTSGFVAANAAVFGTVFAAGTANGTVAVLFLATLDRRILVASFLTGLPDGVVDLIDEVEDEDDALLETGC